MTQNSDKFDTQRSPNVSMGLAAQMETQRPDAVDLSERCL
jgi:hypothetical protein